MNSKYRYLIPNGITFLSLTCGLISILLSANGNFVPAGALILTSFVLDLFDGYSARVLKAGSEFGLQLDSLVDMVSLGVAPTVLAFKHIEAEGVPMVWVWPVCLFVALAGAFRLARFNLLPPKESGDKDSVGLTISSGGASIALAVLSDLAFPLIEIPDILYIPFLLIIAILMVSKVAFPSFFWVFSGRKRNMVLIALFAITIYQFTLFNAWFFWNNVYLGVSLARAGYKSRK
ncbi:MAG: CDP-alcohol phosphatidyltransferase family protein [Ardenticatenaceae bacterium]|nr:CDP-alcohol phosphatidyltransferase family protein [Ardenticatenaceae bacterium]